MQDSYNEAFEAGMAKQAKDDAAEIAKLRAALDEVHSWIVCAGISTPADMMQNAERIEEITRPT